MRGACHSGAANERPIGRGAPGRRATLRRRSPCAGRATRSSRSRRVARRLARRRRCRTMATAARTLALAGAGIALKSIWDVGPDLEAGRLVRVLPAYAAPAAPLHAVYPGGRHLAMRMRAFVDFVRERLQAEWCWGDG
ncbi:LysR substrate-binding domain-containing protein [Burkholderia ubonensis]|uniref:LysR substrate-binding domain-containing protein n=1 Tax=Burkholderia ubonensis TaxID=101571 RepID=UPI001E38DFF4|nr:LysR substrate-binding domain-containing protein [Burkholderia ubonensis]